MKTQFITPILGLALLLGAQHALAAKSVIVSNSSFEVGTFFGANAWFGSTLTNALGAGWQNNFGGGLPNWIGKDDGTGPSAGSGQRPDKTCVLYLTSYRSADGNTYYHTNVRQPLSFDTSKEYVLQFWHNAAASSYNQQCIFDVTLQGISGGGSLSLSGDYGITNSCVGAGNPYYFKQIVFTSGWTSAYLRLRNLATSSQAADAGTYLLLDGITVFERTKVNEIYIKNPSFEASDEQGPGGFGMGFINVNNAFGAINDIMAGWSYFDGGYNAATFGTASNGSPFFAGVVPEGRTAFIDSKSEQWYNNLYPRNSTMLKQTVTGLQPSAPFNNYYLSFNYSARPGLTPGQYSPSNFTVRIGGIELLRHDQMPAYSSLVATTLLFTANASAMELEFGTSNSIDGVSMALDNVMIWPVPEPMALSALGLGLAAWLAGRRAR